MLDKVRTFLAPRRERKRNYPRFEARMTESDTATTTRRTSFLRAPVTFRGIRVTPDTIVEVSALWACGMAISKPIASSTCEVFQVDSEGNRTSMRTHPLWELLNFSPNPALGEMTAFHFWQAKIFEAVVAGDSYAEIERNMMGMPVALYHLDRSRMTPRYDNGGRLYYEHRGPSGKLTALAPRDVFHVRGPTYDGVTSYRLWEIGRLLFEYSRAVEVFGASYFANGAHVGEVFESDKALTQDQWDRLEQQLDEQHGGPGAANDYMILENGLKIRRLAESLDVAQFIETRQFLVDDVCRFCGVPPHKVYQLMRATFCLPADTKVFTECGPKRIADIKAGERVWSKSEDGGWRLSNVERAGPTGIDKILRIRTTNRTLRLNAKHRVLARVKHSAPRGGKGGHQCVVWRNEWRAAGDLRVGDTIVTLASLPDAGTTTAPNGREVTEKFAAFCGLLLGDGNVLASGVCIARHEQAEYMDFYRHAAMESFYALSSPRAVNERHRPIVLHEKPRETRFSSVRASQELMALGLSGTAKTKRVPGWVFQLTEDLRLAFIAGFLDADGTVDKYGRMTFYSVSDALLEDIRHLCMSVGIPVTNARRGPVKTILPNGEQFVGEISAFTCSDPGQNRRVPTATPEYRRRFARGTPFAENERQYPWHGGRGFDTEGCALARIAEITEERAEPVYDLCVAGTHNFIAEGVVVHNSNIEEQNRDFRNDTLIPWATPLQSEINLKLIGRGLPMQAEFDMDWVAEGSILDVSEADGRRVDHGIATRDEIRRMRGLNRRGGNAESLTVQKQMIDIEDMAPDAANAAAQSQEGDSNANSGEGRSRARERKVLNAAARKNRREEA